MHADQIDVSVAQVRRLLAAQYPQLAEEPIKAVIPGGTVNSTFRIGERVGARFPLGPGEPAQILARLKAEQHSASRLVHLTRFATPVPMGLGEPDEDYPYPWALQSWVPGKVADRVDVSESTGMARDLAEFILAVRKLDTGGQGFSGRRRGGVIASQEPAVLEGFERSADLLDVPRLREVWDQLRTLPRGEEPDVMCHQDLMPGNLVVRHGRLVGVIDVGDLGPADPALDLICAWHVLGPEARQVLREELGCSDAQWARGRAWAFVQSMSLPWYYCDSNPVMAAIGMRTLTRIVEDLDRETARAPCR